MNREVIMSALLDRLTAPPMIFAFTADTATGDVTLSNVSDTSGLMLGMPIAGDGIAEHAYVATIDPAVTMTVPATADVTASAVTQGFQTVSRRRCICSTSARSTCRGEQTSRGKSSLVPSFGYSPTEARTPTPFRRSN
jgi:hypothetical protein